jgi:hypothetical protein
MPQTTFLEFINSMRMIIEIKKCFPPKAESVTPFGTLVLAEMLEVG